MERVQSQRLFLMFAREDAGYGINQGPAGYVKIEVREQKGKLQASVQDIREDQRRLSYKLYIIKCDNKIVCPVYAGIIPLKKNRGELQWDFNPNNVDMTGHTINEFNVFAVLAEYNDREYRGIICPLAAYRSEKVLWRDAAKGLLYAEKAQGGDGDDSLTIQKKDVLDIYKAAISDTVPTVSVNTGLQPGYTEIAGAVAGGKEEYKSGGSDETGNEETGFDAGMSGEDADMEYGVESEQDGDGAYGTRHYESMEAQALDMLIGDYQADAPAPAPKNEDNTSFAEQGAEQAGEAEDKAPAEEKTGASDTAQVSDPEDKHEDNAGNSRDPANCSYKFSNFCSLQLPVDGYDPCINCQLYKNINDEKKADGKTGNIDALKSSMDKYFEACDPFGSRRRDYRWWKVTNPAYLNNVLYQCDIKTPLLFNPKVMRAHFKYRYLIVGVYTDRMRRFECIVCGVPGVYGIEEKPFGDNMCRWVQVEGNRPRYGAFGYWLVYIEPRTGSFLSLR